MKRTLRLFMVLAAAVLSVLIGDARPVFAAGEVTIADLQAAVRTFGFLDSLPDDGTIFVGVVYTLRAPETKALAVQTAAWLAALPGPDRAVLRTRIVSVESLAQTSDRLDAVFLLPGLSADSGAIANAIRRRRLVSISNDPACLSAKSCVLMVNASRGVEIVLDTALADAVGANFSTVFTMMVKRR